jgi:hypothetical protein
MLHLLSIYYIHYTAELNTEEEQMREEGCPAFAL